MEVTFGLGAFPVPFLTPGFFVAETFRLGVLGVGALLLRARGSVSSALGHGVRRHGHAPFVL